MGRWFKYWLLFCALAGFGWICFVIWIIREAVLALGGHL